MISADNIAPFPIEGAREKQFDCLSNTRVMDGMEPSGPCEVFTEPHVTKSQARRVAAQLFTVDLTAVAARDDVGCWLTISPPNRKEQLRFRGATWFAALEKAHAFLVEAASRQPEETES